ncbi:DnaJ (Hsp40), sub C, member 2, partial [Perkinsus olseni]
QQQQQAYDWDLVIVIPSHITEFSRRCAVRDGWARQLRDHEQNNRAGLRTIKLVFTVGAHHPDNSTRDTAIAEMKQFDDIITLPLGFVDRYDALGTKVRLSYGEVVDKLG